MRKTIQKTLCLLLSTMVLLVSLTGCGAGGGNETGSGAGTGALAESGGKAQEGSSLNQTASGTKEALTVTNFYSTLSEEFLAAFQEAYPEVTFDIISYAGTNASGYIQHSLELGDIPDIYISTQNFSKEAQEKYLLDLSNYNFINHYSTSLLDAQDVNGGIYLLPIAYQLIGINYNKTILEENGWKAPGNFDELLSLTKEIEAAGYTAFGNAVSLDGYLDSFFFNLGNTIYFGTPEGTEWKEDFPKGKAKAAGNSSVKEVAEYFHEWVENGLITNNHMEAAGFYEGETVFFLGLGINTYEHTAENGKTYEFGTMPWLSRDGSNNMLTRNVSKYIGLNKSLSEKGNEQKLENALKFIDYLSTVEGQQIFMSNNNLLVPTLAANEISEDSPYYEVADLIYEGRTVPLVYVGWEQILIPMASQLRLMLDGNLDADGLIAALDEANDAVLNGVSSDIHGTASETLTLEKTAELVAIAEGMATDADCAMISLNQYHGIGLYNEHGLAWYLYEGSINTDTVNMIRPRAATISTLEMTGAEIKAMRDAGFDANKNGNPYEYLLFTKGDIELDDDAVYKLAVSTGELPEEMREKAEETDIAPVTAIENYIKELGTVSADVIGWE